ncbi:toprim domain-containing protein [Bacteroides intestinalis]|uniref:DNA primase n=1 Tax=Bacteroides intestinalis TaxID=329854 RepID=A0A139L3L3_9BACE|nr:toprim domain-containing protein [Bacteroides intestinalis]KXT46019.1 hypothetical protein HMPREF2531_03205 [Bacteroides intestinalis]
MRQTDIDIMRRIPLADFLARLGHKPVRRSGNELWYLAPYRGERTPSFRVNVAKHLWYDFMIQARFIAEAANMPAVGLEKPTACLPKPAEPAFEEVAVTPLRYSVLTDYLVKRGIPEETALQHCCQLNYTVRRKRYFAVGFPNVAGGYEIRSGLFKGCVPPKDVSLVRTGESPSGGCNVFEGFMDFLSAVALKWTEDEDSLVLNSVTNIARSYKYLDGYGKIRCYLDRDEAGRRVLESLRSRYGDRITDRSNLYDGCKDLNEYLQRSIEKTINNHLKIK